MFTPYYILAVGFGVFAVIVSLIGIKSENEDFPGRFFGPIILVGVLFAVLTFGFAWRGGEKEVEHREHEQSSAAHEAASTVQPPTGVRAGG
jgi:fatty acid desaturase